MKQPKVFGIGFPKTGTSSLGRALQILGYRLQRGLNINRSHYRIEPPVTREKLTALAMPYSHRYNAFEDFPWMALYREMDEAHPGSKFILTMRDPEAWSRSARRHSPELHNGAWRFLAGSNGGDVSHEKFLDAYIAHNQAVREYFRDRPGDLLVWDVETADWPRLCEFLGCRKPRFRSYPHVNQAVTRSLRRIKKEMGLLPALLYLLANRTD